MSDTAFCYEQRRLENELIVLEPFNPDRDVTHLIQVFATNLDMLKYVTFPALATADEFKREVWDNYISKSSADCMYAIFDKTIAPHPLPDQSNYAGIVALSATNPTHAATELGLIIFPAFQRTHVATNAAGLLLLWLLDPPSLNGLGLRRVEWQAHSENEASRKFASRIGFQLEGIARWQRVFPGDKVAVSAEALAKRNGYAEELPGKHTAIYSIVWDEWDEKRPILVAEMTRRD